MRATTRLTTGGLAALTAALALAACGGTTNRTTTTTPPATATAKAPPAATAAPPCRTAALSWTLARLGTAKGVGHARLTARNNGPGTCVFGGYPGLEIHNGKADSIDGAGHGHPAAVILPARAAISVDLRYTPAGTPGAGSWCVRQTEAAVRAPHDSRPAVVPVTDTHLRAASIDACGATVAMAPPRRVAQGR
ncbi:DUF4232 domain-containing protein [Streptomyces sp. CoH27]|uniref:DUF4232 domain-containing protein n=1 Tax=Streptomyces sp. CoH27 TaxID=2875763 RepID=UPI001CD5CD0C|nr:DUF4232 domain-containing protein [Streptomyces sp. CoH27]